MSDNVVMYKKSKYYNVSTSCMKGNRIYILVALHEVIHLDNLLFFTEKGVMIPQSCLDETKRGCVLLGMFQVKKIWQTKTVIMTESNFEQANKYYINQIKPNSGSYHFGTSGAIFGLGYGPDRILGDQSCGILGVLHVSQL